MLASAELRCLFGNEGEDICSLLNEFLNTLGFDASAVDEQVQRTRTATIGDAHVQLSLAAAQGAEVRHRPVQPDQLQQALHEAGRLPQRHAKEYLHRQARLDRGITENRRPASLSRRGRLPNHIGINHTVSEPSRLSASL